MSSEENAINFYRSFYSRLKSLVSTVEIFPFRLVEIFSPTATQSSPLNLERHWMGAVRCDVTVMLNRPLYIAPTPLKPFTTLLLSPANSQLSSAPPCFSSSPSTAPLHCRTALAQDYEVTLCIVLATVATHRHQVRVRRVGSNFSSSVSFLCIDWIFILGFFIFLLGLLDPLDQLIFGKSVVRYFIRSHSDSGQTSYYFKSMFFPLLDLFSELI